MMTEYQNNGVSLELIFISGPWFSLCFSSLLLPLHRRESYHCERKLFYVCIVFVSVFCRFLSFLCYFVLYLCRMYSRCICFAFSCIFFFSVITNFLNFFFYPTTFIISRSPEGVLTYQQCTHSACCAPGNYDLVEIEKKRKKFCGFFFNFLGKPLLGEKYVEGRKKKKEKEE